MQGDARPRTLYLNIYRNVERDDKPFIGRVSPIRLSRPVQQLPFACGSSRTQRFWWIGGRTRGPLTCPTADARDRRIGVDIAPSRLPDKSPLLNRTIEICRRLGMASIS